jgi:hypothetical protein
MFYYQCHLCRRIGGNPDLTERGWSYGHALAKYFNEKTVPGLRQELAY